MRLRSLRKDAGLTGQQLAQMSGLGRTTISAGENAQHALSVREVHQLLLVLCVAGGWRELTSVAMRAEAAGWWSSYRGVLDARQILHADLEGGAAAVRVYAHARLPDPLHTTGYAQHRAALNGRTVPPLGVAEALAMRQHLLQTGGVDFQAVIEESMLRRLWAPPPVLHGQLDHLAACAEQGQLRVLEVTARVPRPPETSFAVYSYAWREPMRLVAVESDTGDRVFHDDDHLARYEQLHAEVLDAALNPADSAALVRALPAEGAL